MQSVGDQAQEVRSPLVVLLSQLVVDGRLHSILEIPQMREDAEVADLKGTNIELVPTRFSHLELRDAVDVSVARWPFFGDRPVEADALIAPESEDEAPANPRNLDVRLKLGKIRIDYGVSLKG